MPTLNISGVDHSYELTPPTKNSKLPVIVFIHGWLLSRRYWQPLIELLRSDYQCLIYDLRGFGDSGTTSKLEPKTRNESRATRFDKAEGYQYSLRAYARDLECLLQNLGIEKAWLIGHSLGGSIALWTADICPQRVRGVVCVNSGGGIYLKEEFERFRNVGQQLVKFRPSWLRYVPLMDFIFARMMVARPLTLSWGRQRIIDFIQAEEQAALGALLESTTESEVHLLPQLVSRLQQPVYFIAGGKDRVMESKYVHHLASFHKLFVPNASNVFEVPNCGHLGMLEYPEEIAAIVDSAIKKHELN